MLKELKLLVKSLELIINKSLLFKILQQDKKMNLKIIEIKVHRPIGDFL